MKVADTLYLISIGIGFNWPHLKRNSHSVLPSGTIGPSVLSPSSRNFLPSICELVWVSDNVQSPDSN